MEFFKTLRETICDINFLLCYPTSIGKHTKYNFIDDNGDIIMYMLLGLPSMIPATCIFKV